MADYKRMYHALFNSVTDAVRLLQDAQAKTEEMFVERDEPEVISFEHLKEGEGDNSSQ